VSNKIAKTQLIDLVSEHTKVSKAEVAKTITAALDTIVGALKEGKSVGLPGLGTFSVTETKERQGVRPGTKDPITIPAGKKVRFKVATTLRDQI
jgi:DNA-binding protein HU-beta